jgi:hypothetical protein
VERSKPRVGHGGIFGQIINADVTLELRHDIIIVNFAEITRQMLRHADVPSFSFPVKHFEIPFRATRAQYADHALDLFNKK